MAAVADDGPITLKQARELIDGHSHQARLTPGNWIALVGLLLSFAVAAVAVADNVLDNLAGRIDRNASAIELTRDQMSRELRQIDRKTAIIIDRLNGLSPEHPIRSGRPVDVP